MSELAVLEAEPSVQVPLELDDIASEDSLEIEKEAFGPYPSQVFDGR